MPWSAKDATRHSKGLTGAAAEKWAKVANGVLQSCQKDGGGDCEAMAIRIANKQARRVKQAEALVAQYSGAALEEAGRVIARRHYERIKQAIAMLQAALQDQDGRDYAKQVAGLDRAVKSATKAVAEAYEDDPVEDEELSEAERSFDETRRLVQAALTAQRKQAGPGSYAYIRDLFDDYMVFEAEGEGGGALFRATYSINADDNSVTLGEPKQVVEKRQYVAVGTAQEAAEDEDDPDAVELDAEADPDEDVVLDEHGTIGRPSYAKYHGRKRKSTKDIFKRDRNADRRTRRKLQKLGEGDVPDTDGDGEPGEALYEAYAPGSDVVMLEEKAVGPDGTVPIKIASPGWGSKGYYSADVLKRDGTKAWPKGTQMYWNHPTEQEEAARPERDLRDLAAVTVADPYYDANGPKGEGLYTKAKVFSQYQPAVDEMAPHIGVSLRAAGTVTWGEAEGKEGPLVESILQGKSIDFVTKAGRGGEVVSLFESARGGNFKPGVYAGANTAPAGGQEDDVSKEELEEAQRTAAAATTKAARLEEAMAVRDARELATVVLSRATLPDATKARLVESLAGNPPMAEADGIRTLDRDKFRELVEAKAKEEAAYVAQLLGQNGTPRGLSESGTDPFNPAQPEPLDEAKVEAELASLFGSIGLSEAEAKAAAHGRGW